MAGPDLSIVTAAVDFGTVTTAILGVVTAIIVVYIAWKGAKMVLLAVGGSGENGQQRFERVRDAMENGTVSDDDWNWIWSDAAQPYRDGTV
ncbi:MAG: hypothetical protein FD157_3513 [Rhodocyclaceae bacterium]|nr:MAG: hypothetical protein FD157_3513 [Rhodocyclaceae bacterium]TND01874.1 MAG: hypothetical protein FD118_2133 [Rhodocyclaceae bacterium]